MRRMEFVVAFAIVLMVAFGAPLISEERSLPGREVHGDGREGSLPPEVGVSTSDQGDLEVEGRVGGILLLFPDVFGLQRSGLGELLLGEGQTQADRASSSEDGNSSDPDCLVWPGDCLGSCDAELTACYLGCLALPVGPRAGCRLDCYKGYDFCMAVCIYPS